MIELMYFDAGQANKGYQVIQFRAGESWRVVEDGELLGSVEKLNGSWRGRDGLADRDFIEGIGALIDGQHFNRLPLKMKSHWAEQLREVIAQGDNQYLVICKPDVDFARFEKVFSAYVPGLVEDCWEIRFRVYDAEMSEDFQVFVKHKMLVG